MNDRSVALRGGFWTSLSTIVVMAAMFGRIMILTRFLAKEDFGIVAIANMVIGMCTIFTDLGFSSVIMYKKQLTRVEFSSLYWTQFILFLLIYFVIFLISPFSASFYNEPLLEIVIPYASLTVVLQAIGKLYDSVLQKNYQFKKLAFRNILSAFVSVILAWLLASKGYGIYSLIYSTLFNMLIINIWNLLTGFRVQPIGLTFSVKDVKSLAKIGIYQTGTRILDFFSSKLDVLIIGKLLGMDALGLYDLAKELVFKFVDFIRTVVSKVALPILSNNNNNSTMVVTRFLQVTKLVATLCIPICITISVFSPYIVRIVYGESYINAASLVSIFAILTIITSISSFIDMLGIAKGRTDLNFKNTLYRILVTTPVILICSFISIECVAWGQLLASVLMFGIFWNIVVMGTFPIKLSIYFTQFKKIFILGSLIGVFMYLLMQILKLYYSINWIIEFSIYIGVYILLWILCSIHFMKDEIGYYIKLLKRK